MLTITETAGTVVKALADRAAADPSTARGSEADPRSADQESAVQPGLRISSAADGRTFEVAVADAPAPTDQVVSSDGARVYLQEDAAVALDAMVLDARVDDTGSVHFSVTDAA